MSNVSLRAEINDKISLNHDLLLQNLNNASLLIKSIQDGFQSAPADKSLTIRYLSVNSLDTIVEILDHFIPIAINNQLKSRVEHPELDVLEQIYKSLRNCLINGAEIQNLVFNNVRLMSHTRDLLSYLIDLDASVSKANLCLVLQFMCNLVVMNPKTQIGVWKYYKIAVLKSLLRFDVAHVSVMIIYNICKEHADLLPRDIDFVLTIIKLMPKDIENFDYLLELIFEKNVITDKYDQLDIDTKVSLLEHLHHFNRYGYIQLPVDLILLFVHHFKKKADCILKTVDQYLNQIDPLEVSKLLDLIASVSHKEDISIALQGDKSLLITVVYLLKSIHEFGKVGGNNFSTIQKLSELTNRDSELQEHPAFGFKAALIRLIGSLCSGHKANQDMIRELECIPLLMDCCNLDARNPLIMQWVIFAIRLLCDGNHTNQNIIAKMSKVGVVDSQLILEAGMMLAEDGNNKIGIVPLYLPK